jgi:cytochrome c biogenesis protein CcmG/thiol:disulfide interchange protein DsbE
MRRLAAATALAFLMLPCAGWAQTPLRDGYLKRFLGKPAPPFALKDIQGRAVKLSDYRGKVVLLNFWYSACFPCRAETPDLISLYRAHESRGLAVLGINTDELLMGSDQGRMLRSFLDAFKIPYPILIADRKVFEDYGRTPIAPITLLVDPRGTIARVFWGATSGREFESAIRPYLEARAAGGPAKGAASAP